MKEINLFDDIDVLRKFSQGEDLSYKGIGNAMEAADNVTHFLDTIFATALKEESEQGKSIYKLNLQIEVNRDDKGPPLPLQAG